MTPRVRFGFGFGAAGVVFSLGLAIAVSLAVFLDPSPPFAAYPDDARIALVYLAAFGLIVVLGAGTPRLLLALTVLTLVVALGVTLTTGEWALNLILWAWMLWLAWRLGDALMRRFGGPHRVSWLEAAVLALPLGWGVLMVATLLLGLFGLYRREVFCALMVGGVWFL